VLGQRSFAQTKRKITLYLKVECLEPHWLFFYYKYQSLYNILQQRAISGWSNRRTNLIP
jgi:hypothetical protein